MPREQRPTFEPLIDNETPLSRDELLHDYRVSRRNQACLLLFSVSSLGVSAYLGYLTHLAAQRHDQDVWGLGVCTFFSTLAAITSGALTCITGREANEIFAEIAKFDTNAQSHQEQQQSPAAGPNP